jgi:hypothetical protein
MTSPFAKYENEAWPHRYRGEITVRNLAGGTPSDPNIAESWLKTKLTGSRDDLIREKVAEIMVERNITAEQATQEADKLKHLNGFKRTSAGQLYIEGRQLKAAVKEAVSVAVAAGKVQQKGWGVTKKFLGGFVAEHIMIVDETLALFGTTGAALTEPDQVIQSFPKNPRTGQTGIQYTEVCTEAVFSFTMITDYEFTEHDLAMFWLTGQEQGLGASRSQGYGRYQVTAWEKTTA